MREKKSLALSYALCVLGFFGVSGIHRFYMGKIGTGILYLFTGGLLGIGTIVDLCTMHSKVEKENIIIEYENKKLKEKVSVIVD